MNRTETLKIMAVLRGAYPQFYRQTDRTEADDIVNLWNEMFSDDPYPIVGAAVKALIATDTRGFPPVIGQVREKIQMLTNEREMTALEAWSLVSGALRNSSYNSKEEFEKLPEVVQSVVGSPDQLREWAGMDVDTIQSVVGSNFQRSFQGRAKAARDWAALPAGLKEVHQQLIAAATKPMPELPPQNEQAMIEAKDKAIKNFATAERVREMLQQAIGLVKQTDLPDDEPDEQSAQEFEQHRASALQLLRGAQ